MVQKNLSPTAHQLVPLVLLMCLATCGDLAAGWIEATPQKTIIHLNVWLLPDPNNPDTFTRSEVAGVNLFKKRFPDFFAERYREKYKALPGEYGQHNWDNVEIQLHKSTGIVVEGVEVDLMQIAGDLAPDILYVNFRKSDNYIQAGFLYPLDKSDDGYLGDLRNAEINDDGISRSDRGIDLLGMTDE